MLFDIGYRRRLTWASTRLMRSQCRQTVVGWLLQPNISRLRPMLRRHLAENSVAKFDTHTFTIILILYAIHVRNRHIYTVSQKKLPTFKLSVTSSNLNRFSNFYTAGKRMKFATKTAWHYPPHLRRVATLPWEIKNSNFLQIFSDNTRYGRKCKQIAF